MLLTEHEKRCDVMDLPTFPTLEAAAPIARRRPAASIPARFKDWLSQTFAALTPSTRRRVRNPQWVAREAPQLLKAAQRLALAPETSRGGRFDYLLRLSESLPLPDRQALQLELADHLAIVPDRARRTEELTAAMASLREELRRAAR